MSLNDTVDPSPIADGPLALHWQSSPEFRGTAQILITCLSTLIFCVWGALHLDIGRRVKYAAWLHKMGWVMCSIFALEVLMIIAFNQWRGASTLIQRVNQRPKADPSPSLDVEMDGCRSPTGCTHFEHSSQHGNWTLTHGFYAVMGGFVVEDSAHVLDSAYLLDNRITLDTDGILHLLKHVPESIPTISEDSIKDHSKAGGIAKGIQFIQVSWFCINCICRRAQGLPLSLLEVYTLAHAICMLIVYLIWLKKPLEIKEPTIIDGENAAKICCQLQAYCSHRSFPYELGIKVLKRPHLAKWVMASSESVKLRFMIFAFLGALYGAVHFLAWNSTFPTSVEGDLWRIAAIILTCAGTCSALTFYLVDKVKDMYYGWLYYIGTPSLAFILLVTVIAYCTANLYVLVESFRQLLYLPPRAYQLPVWSNYWPHFG